MSNYNNNSNNDYRVTSKNEPCPICGNEKGHCRIHRNNEIFLCMGVDNPQKLEVVGNYKCLKVGDTWATFKLDDSKLSDSDRQKSKEVRLKTQEAVAEKARELKENALDLPARDKGIRALSAWFGLADDHKADLLRRGLSEEQIAKGLYFSVDKNAIAPVGLPRNLAGIKDGKMCVTGRGYACVSFNLDGLATGYQVRLETEKNKYRWAVGEASSHFKSGELPLTALLNQDPSEVAELFLCEGLNKAYIAHCIHAINLLGASSGNFAAVREQVKDAIAALPNLERVIIIPDAGAIGNPHVLKQYAKTSDLISEIFGIKPQYLWWEQVEKADLDIDELRSLDNTRIVDAIVKEEKPSRKSHYETLEAPTELAIVDAHPEQRYQEIVAKMGLKLADCATSRPFDAWVVEELLKDDYTVISGDFYHWEKVEGYWKKQQLGLIKHMIARAGDRAYSLTHTKQFGWVVDKSHKKEGNAIKFARDYLASFKQETNQALRTFRNGTLDLVTGELREKRKEDLVTSFIDCDYIPNQPIPEIFDRFLKESFGEEAIASIRAVTSMFLDPTAPWLRFPYLIGASGGGKSTLGQLWGDLFDTGYGAGDFQGSLGKAERRHDLSGLSLFGFPDCKGFMSGEALTSFYKMVRNEVIDARPLYQAQYSKRFNLRFWVASYSFLGQDDQSEGWLKRELIIPVKNAPKEIDPFLGQKLRDVRGQIISWALRSPN